MREFKVLIKDAHGNIEVRYVSLEVKIALEEERNIERQFDILKRAKDPLQQSVHKENRTRRITEAKKLAKRLDAAKENSIKIKESLNVHHKQVKKIPGQIGN